MKARISISGYNSRKNKFDTVHEIFDAPEFYDEETPAQFSIAKLGWQKLKIHMQANMALVYEIANKKGIATVEDFSVSYVEESRMAISLAAQDVFEKLNSNEARANFVACYMRMRENLQGLPINRQMNILLDALNIGMQAREIALEEAKKILGVC